MKLRMLALAPLAVLAFAAPSLGGGAPIVAKPLAVGKIRATTVHVTSGAVILDSIRGNPGGSFGWHKHGAAVEVVVTAGTLTVLDPTVGNCTPFTVTKGQSFVEPANHVHLARNDGKAPVTLYALYLGLPNAAASNSAETAPDGCKA